MFSRDAVLQCSPDVALQRTERGWEIRAGAEWRPVPPDVLPILHAFLTPARVATVVGQLAHSSPAAVLGTIAHITQLARLGVLVPAAEDPGAAKLLISDAELRYHRQLLAARRRVTALQRAIAGHVRPGDVVVDVGTGTGVLAVSAARAGAHRVYAIDNGAISEVAREVVRDNGVADRVRIIEGDARTIDLPERADVLIAELVGVDPFDEAILEIVPVCRERWLKPGGVLLPSRVTLLLAPAAIPLDRRAWWAASPDVVEWWQQLYHIDFGALSTRGRSTARRYVNPSRALSWCVAAPARAVTVALAGHHAGPLRAAVVSRPTRGGAINGVVGGFELEVTPGDILSSFDRADEATEWDAAVWAVDPVNLTEDERVRILYELGLGDTEARVSLQPLSPTVER